MALEEGRRRAKRGQEACCRSDFVAADCWARLAQTSLECGGMSRAPAESSGFFVA
jgi:hypothetical protein